MGLQQIVFTDRFVNKNPTLEQSENTCAFMLVSGVAAVATAAIGSSFFKMNKTTAAVTTVSGSLVSISAVTQRDGPLYILGIATIIATGVATINAYREGRFYITLDLARLLQLVKDLLQGN